MGKMKERLLDWGRSVPEPILFFAVMLLLPVRSISRLPRKLLAPMGLAREQRCLLAALAKQRVRPLRVLGRVLWDTDDYLHANMISPALGTEVLGRQVAAERNEEEKRGRLTAACRAAGISEWRIKAVL